MKRLLNTGNATLQMPQYCERNILNPDACLANALDENLVEPSGETCLKRQKRVVVCGDIGNITKAIRASAVLDSTFNKVHTKISVAPPSELSNRLSTTMRL